MFAVADNCGPTYVSVPLLTYGDRLIQTPIFVGRPAVVYRRGDPDIIALSAWMYVPLVCRLLGEEMLLISSRSGW
jgi:hypothetical protein